MSQDCFAWSFSINVQDGDAHCHYVHRQDKLADLELKYSPGAFMETKSCTIERLKSSKLNKTFVFKKTIDVNCDFVANKIKKEWVFQVLQH